MTSTPYKRKFPADGDTPDDDSGWDDQDEELARGFPLEPDIAAAPGSMGPDGLPWYAYRGQVADSPMPDQGSYATVDEAPSEPEGAKGVSPSGGVPITDAIAQGDTTPEATVVTAEKPSFWERYRQGVEHTPVLTKAPWWRDLAARGMGAAAGWVNAAGHLRNPINAGAAEEEIRHPGFSQQQEVWESQMAPIRAGLSAEMGQREAQLKAQDTAAQAQLRQAQSQQALGRGHWYEAQAGQRWKVDDKAGILYNQDTHEMIPLPNDKVSMYQQILKATGDPALAKYEAFDKYKASPTKQGIPIGAGGLYLPDTGEVVARPPDPYRAAADADRQARTEMERTRIGNQVDEQKRTNEARVQNWLQTQIRERTAQAMQQARDRNRPFDPKSVDTSDLRQQAARELQAAQDTYAAAVRRAGGSAPDYDIDPNTLAARPRGGGGAPKVATIADLQAYAQKNGVTLDQAKQAAIGKGYSIAQ